MYEGDAGERAASYVEAQRDSKDSCLLFACDDGSVQMRLWLAEERDEGAAACQ